MSTTGLDDNEKKFYPFLDPSDANYNETVEEFKLMFPNSEWKVNDQGVFMIVYSPEIVAVLKSQNETEEQPEVEAVVDVMPVVETEDDTYSTASFWEELFGEYDSEATETTTEPDQILEDSKESAPEPSIVSPLPGNDFSPLELPTTLNHTCEASCGDGGLFADNETCELSIEAYNYLVDFIKGLDLLYPDVYTNDSTPLQSEALADKDMLSWFYDGFMITRLITIDTWIDANVSKAMAHTGMPENQRNAAVEMIKDIRSWEEFMISVLDSVRSVPAEARDDSLVNTGRDVLVLNMLIELQGSLPEYIPVDAVENDGRIVSINDERDPIYPVPVATRPTIGQSGQRPLVADRNVREWGANSTSYTYTCPFSSCGHSKIAFSTVKEHLVHNHLNASLKVLLPNHHTRAKVLQRMWRVGELVVDNHGEFIDHKEGLLEVLLRRGIQLGPDICREDNVRNIVETWQREDVREVKDSKNRVICRKLTITKESEPEYDVFVRNLVGLGLVRKRRRKSRFSDPENRSPVGYDEFEHNRNLNVKLGSNARSVGDNEIEEDEQEAGTIRAAKRRKITPETASNLYTPHNVNVPLDPLTSFDSNNINPTIQGNDDDAAMFDIPSSAPSTSSQAQFNDLLYSEIRQLQAGYTH